MRDDSGVRNLPPAEAPHTLRTIFRGPGGPLAAIVLSALAGLMLLAAALMVAERRANASADALEAAHTHQFVQSSRLDPIEIRLLRQQTGEELRLSAGEARELSAALKASLEGLVNRRKATDDPAEQRLLDRAISSLEESVPEGPPGDVGQSGGDTLASGDPGESAERVSEWIVYSSGTLAEQREQLSQRRWQLGLVVLLALALSIVAGGLMWTMLRNVTRRSLADLERAATTDVLTGLENQRAFHKRLPEEVARSERSGLPLGLVLLDVDNFKAINDTHGHQTGDRVLAAIGRSLDRASRAGETVARIGGEEFAWLTPDSDSWGALAAAERARAAIGKISIDGVGPISASAGVAEHEPGGDADLLVRHADQALYLAKANGRNASFRFGPGAAEVFEGALTPEDFLTPPSSR